jgi:hypothetical protein
MPGKNQTIVLGCLKELAIFSQERGIVRSKERQFPKRTRGEFTLIPSAPSVLPRDQAQ